MSDYYYTDERNAQIVISLLKAHGIKKIVASPGTTNICLVASLQQDPFFEIYSSADERSAGYIACGLSAESGEPVVLSCTGATASRNYMSALTEAYYRKLPILVITSSRSNFQIGHNIDQVTDRTVLPKDVAKLSVQLPLIFNNDEAEWGCIIAANKAILELSHRGNGPVHINLETSYSWNYDVKKLPDVRAIYRFSNESNLPKVKAERIAIMVGAHLKWDDRLVGTVERFCELYNAVVLCDHTSNYKGKYGIFANLSTQQRNFDSIIKKAEMIIHLGDISASNYNIEAKEVWRVNPDGELRDPYKKLHYVFEMEEVVFFEKYVDISNKKKKTEFYDQCSDELKELKESLLEALNNMPFSNIWIASQTASKLPENSILHMGIQNSLRSWNFFEIPKSVLAYCNTGGFGIDGCISSAIGASLVNRNRIIYCILGDLAFFYDMNSLGNHHISNNLRILLINNGKGTEFKLTSNPGSMFEDKADEFIAAGGHYGNKSKSLVRHYAEDLGFEYISASNKEEYMKNMSRFIIPQLTEKPMVFEVFTNDMDEVSALQTVRTLKCSNETDSAKQVVKGIVKDLIGDKGVGVFKKIMKK